jgi:hypothetical protein
LNVEFIQPRIDLMFCCFAFQSAQFGQEIQIGFNRHAGVHPAFFWQIPNVVQKLAVDVFSFEIDASAIGFENLVDETNERCFSRAIGTEQSMYFARIKLHGHVGQSRVFTEMFGYVLDF